MRKVWYDTAVNTTVPIPVSPVKTLQSKHHKVLQIEVINDLSISTRLVANIVTSSKKLSNKSFQGIGNYKLPNSNPSTINIDDTTQHIH